MSEATIQAELMTALAPLVLPGSVLVNDYRTPQVVSTARAPWLIIETADTVQATTGEAWVTPRTVYDVYVSLLTYRGGRDDKDHMNAFQALRQDALDVLIALGPSLAVVDVSTAGAIAPYFSEDGTENPDSLYQRLSVSVVEFGG